MPPEKRASVDGRRRLPREEFADVLEGNARYVEEFQGQELTGRAACGLAVVTCIDSRIDPLALLGLNAGDGKILRNAGARVTDDVLRTLVLATHLLNVRRVLVMAHSDCKMASATEAQIHNEIEARGGPDTRGLEFHVIDDQAETLAADVARIRAYPLLPASLVVAGAIYDVHTGRLEPIDV
ncbi:MAG: carbonic anhydrase [Candidatus Nanopelagicales bacterium]|nr:carbonic anhydrase [Candidatus Nanopelagicales bacterium]MDZ4250787.1 carbonic anhydrase [Candidatus Nanopelagicales bacterium]